MPGASVSEIGFLTDDKIIAVSNGQVFRLSEKGAVENFNAEARAGDIYVNSSNNNIYFIGYASVGGKTLTNNITQVDTRGYLVDTFNALPIGSVKAVWGDVEGSLYVSGTMQDQPGHYKSGIHKLSSTGEYIPIDNPALNQRSYIADILPHNGKMLATGNIITEDHSFISGMAELVFPGKLENLAAMLNSDTEVKLTWKPSSLGLNGITILQSTDDVNFTTVERIVETQTNYIVDGLKEAQDYTFRLTSTNDLYDIEPVSVHIKTGTKAPLAKEADNFTPTSFDVSWDPNGTAGHYFFQMSITSDFTSLVSGYENLETTETRLTITNLHDMPYYYRVKKRINNVDSEYSSVVSFNAAILAVDDGLPRSTFYPNPCRETVTVEIPQSTYPTHVRVLSVEGRQMQEIVTNSEKEIIDTSGLAEGLYFLWIGRRAQKLVKVRN